jgi:hypothetical protein
MLINYLDGYARARNLDIVVQTITGEPSFLFSGLSIYV